jgi:hypothetical protein
MTRQRLAEIDVAIALLCELYPRTFCMFERRRKPLAVGVHKDIFTAPDGAVTPRKLRHAPAEAGISATCAPAAVLVDHKGQICARFRGTRGERR